MFTKPSLGELLDGVSKTAELVLLPALADSPHADRLIEALMILDRVSAEWSDASRHLRDDNEDIRATLARIGTPVADAATEQPVGSVESLAAENRRLKAALCPATRAPRAAMRQLCR